MIPGQFIEANPTIPWGQIGPRWSLWGATNQMSSPGLRPVPEEDGCSPGTFEDLKGQAVKPLGRLNLRVNGILTHEAWTEIWALKHTFAVLLFIPGRNEVGWPNNYRERVYFPTIGLRETLPENSYLMRNNRVSYRFSIQLVQWTCRSSPL